MYSLDSIQHINFEISSYCNAKCPQCQRYDTFGNIHKSLNQTNLDKKIIKTIPLNKMKNLKDISFIGNFGDPLMHPDLDEILDFFSKQKISISTNASLRNMLWWGNIAKKFPGIMVTFCIDGLEDTHSLYRINTSYTKIIDNAKVFIDNGGRARWQFIVFKHNEHQIDEARQIANRLGFEKIFFMYSDRFDTSDKWKVYQNGKNVYTLEKSSKQTTLRNHLKSNDGEKYWKKMFEGAEKKNIECVWAKNKKIYVHSDGTVFPCCFIGCIKNGRPIEEMLFKKIVKNWHNVNLYSKNLEEIINGPYYKDYFARSLLDSPHPLCIEHCNKATGKIYNNKYLNTL